MQSGCFLMLRLLQLSMGVLVPGFLIPRLVFVDPGIYRG